MKKTVIFMVALAFFCLSPKVHAQAKWYVDAEFPDEIYSDTLHIVLPGNDKVLIMGKEFKELKDFADKAEALKTTFIADLKAAYASGKLSANAQEVYYFYKNAAQRRIKAEAAEYTEKRVDVAQEMLRMDLFLPKHKFIILDMESKIEWQLYVNNPDSLAYKLENTNIKQAIEVGTANKKYRRQSTQLWVDTDSSAYSVSHFQHKRQFSFSIGPIMGLSLIGSELAPNLGIWAMFQNSGKYGKPPYQLGIGLTEYMMADINEGKLANYQMFYSVEAMCLFNLSTRSKTAKWFGIQAGVLKAPSEHVLHNASKLSIVSSGIGPVQWSFDFIEPRNEKGLLYGLTLKLPF
ncbi:MAG: hypothetical protein Q8R57_12615 [Bacteroidota bacterium]|nr:hypothetical protein [Bacteroidota bacterium]